VPVDLALVDEVAVEECASGALQSASAMPTYHYGWACPFQQLLAIGARA
jgi:hypothetical protein